MRRLLLVAIIAGLLVPAADADATRSYGGGSLPSFAPKRRTDPATVSIRVRGKRVAMQFDSTVACGKRTFHDAFDTGSGRIHHGRARIRGRGATLLARGRFRYRWRARFRVGPRAAKGWLHITGHLPGRRRACRSVPRGPFTATRGRPGGPPAAQRAGGAYFGLNTTRVVQNFRGGVLVRVSKNGRRVEALWEAQARCRRGQSQFLPNFTPPTRIRPDHSFVRRERFTVHFSDAVVRFRVSFGGRFTADGVKGKLRVRARVRWTTRPRYTTHCDSGTRSWSALAG